MSISAKIIADSISPAGIRITTMELNYHRFIHSEFNTHRMFSRNASSSRAIPVEKMLDQVRNNPAMPIHWGKNQPGMQAREETPHIDMAIIRWRQAASSASYRAEVLIQDCELHKQITNRVLEPFQYIKVIVTATEWDNFFKLRLHVDAQPEISELARCMKEAMQLSEPTPLTEGEWHLPYVKTTRKEYDDSQEFWSQGYDTAGLSDEKAIKCSVARCARVSYNNHDNSNPNWEKDIALADRLLEAGHMSPFEHQATPFRTEKSNPFWWEGQTHIDQAGNRWSGNFREWVQWRQML